MLKTVIILTIIFTKSRSHTPQNTSDVIIYAGHADLPQNDAIFYTTGKSERTQKKETTEATKVAHSKEFMEQTGERETENPEQAEKEDVMFVPTEGFDDRVVHEDTGIRIVDILNSKRETEPPPDILFIQGKNNERQDRPAPRQRSQYRDEAYEGGGRRNMDYDDYTEKTTTTKIPMDCINLDCHNQIDSICGAKKERSEVKYRLFLNECYFRKVNCAFSYEMSRYEQVDLKYCKNIGAHATKRTELHYQYYPEKPTTTYKPRARASARRMNGRRSMTMNMAGGYCGHDCPWHCPKDYDPECAMNAMGERRVFENHCVLDRTSCEFNIVWRRRPLSECVGGKRADMEQNKAFISWMQRVGIVDRKGKLVLS